MKPYEENKLFRKYIEESIVISINEHLKIRLPKSYLEKYKSGLYANALQNWNACIEEIKQLNINYPSNAHPIVYMYIVPNNQFVELLNFPKEIATKGGGKPVVSYDLESFPYAYGTSSNLMENCSDLSIF